jgi:hypothetical protein
MIWKADIFGFIYLDSLKRPYAFRVEDLYLLMYLGQRIALAVMYAQFVEELMAIIESLDFQRWLFVSEPCAGSGSDLMVKKR